MVKQRDNFVFGFFRWLLGLALALALFLGAVLALLIFWPNSPLPDSLNPTKPFVATADPNMMTDWKLRRATRTPEKCMAALGQLRTSVQKLSDQPVANKCGIPMRVKVSRLSAARMKGLETACPIALRLSMWEYHSVQPAAQKHFGLSVQSLSDFGSFSCRPIRGTSGSGRRMSQHATANAVDIAAFRLSNGNQISLQRDWEHPKNGLFLKEVRNGACDWFNVTLSPEYNSLHADHFHFDMGPWRTCR